MLKRIILILVLIVLSFNTSAWAETNTPAYDYPDIPWGRIPKVQIGLEKLFLRRISILPQDTTALKCPLILKIGRL